MIKKENIVKYNNIEDRRIFRIIEVNDETITMGCLNCSDNSQENKITAKEEDIILVKDYIKQIIIKTIPDIMIADDKTIEEVINSNEKFILVDNSLWYFDFLWTIIFRIKYNDKIYSAWLEIYMEDNEIKSDKYFWIETNSTDITFFEKMDNIDVDQKVMVDLEKSYSKYDNILTML